MNDEPEEHPTEIPKEFYSTSTAELFDRCIECDKYLLDGETEYLIEKAVKNYQGYQASDVLFDYAICLECAHRLHSQMSRESIEKIETFFRSNINFSNRFGKDKPEDALQFTEYCLVNGSPKDQCSEYQLYAHCCGDKLFSGNPPYMISGSAIEEVVELLSKATKDELGGFFDKHFSPDPGLFEVDPTRRLILV